MNYIVRIPEPCHEDWNKMQPDEKGRFCNSCSKSVYDFTNKTDDYIHTVLKENTDQQVCGHFRKSQLDRPLQLNISFKQLNGNVSRVNAFAVALFFVFGTFLFSCSNDNGQKINSIGMSDIPKQEETMSRGLPEQIIDTVKNDSTNVVECTTMSGEIMMTEPMVNGGLSYREETVDGGMMVEEIQPVEQIQEPMIAGGISYRHMEIEEPIITETVSTNADTISTERIIAPGKEFKFQVYPNPNNGEFNISYEVLQKGTVQIVVYDITGSLVRTIVKSQTQHTGRYIVPAWLGDLANGIYICKTIINGKEQHEEVVIAK